MPEGILIGEGRGLPKRKDKTSKKAKVGKDKDPKNGKIGASRALSRGGVVRYFCVLVKHSCFDNDKVVKQANLLKIRRLAVGI